MLIIVEFILVVVATVRGWRYLTLVPVLIAFGIAFLLGLAEMYDAAIVVDIILIIVLIIMAAVGRDTESTSSRSFSSQRLYGAGVREAQKRCPHCAEYIQWEAKVCRYCGRDVSEPIAQVQRTQPPVSQPIATEASPQLSSEERRVLQLIYDSSLRKKNPTQDIANALNITSSEALNYQSHLRDKIGGVTNSEMVEIAKQKGLLT